MSNDPIVTMDVHEHPNKTFMARFPRYEPTILDHTAMIQAKQCLRKYFYRIVLGRATKEDAIYFAWGSAYHKFREVLEQTYGYGNNAPPKYDSELALSAFLAAVNAGKAYWIKHGTDQDTMSKFSWMTLPRLILSFKKAYEHWTLEKQRGNIEVIAVEQPFNLQLADGSHRSGRADQIVRWQGKVWGRDFKTSSKEGAFYERTLTPNEQFTGYTWAEGKLSGSEVQGQMIETLYNAKAVKAGEKGPEIKEYIVSKTDYELKMWEKEHMFWRRVIDMAREEDNWPMSEVGCTFCEYHSVCGKGSEAGQMNELESKFKISPWDNTKIGQDL